MANQYRFRIVGPTPTGDFALWQDIDASRSHFRRSFLTRAAAKAWGKRAAGEHGAVFMNEVP